MNKMKLIFAKSVSPKHVYYFSSSIIPWLQGATAILFFIGLVWSLVIAPSDYQQGPELP